MEEKKWPTPIETEDAFKLSPILVHFDKGCLNIEGNIIGNVRNLKELWLEIEEGTLCTRCPFKPDMRVRYPITSRGLKFKSNSFALTYCPQQGHKVSRLRVIGINRYRSLAPVFFQYCHNQKN